MNPRRNFQGHPIEYHHFQTPRHSGLMPYHLKRRHRRYDPILILVCACIILGMAALAVFVVQVVR